MADLLARMQRVAGCPDSHRVWCVVSAGWADGAAPDLPASGVLAGLTIGLERDRPDAELLETEVALSAFAVAHGRALITDIPPENAAEKRTIAAAVHQLAAELKGAAPAPLPPTLARYLTTLPVGATHPLTRDRDGRTWRMSGKAEAWIRRLPSGAWVAVEVPPEGPVGIFVSIYPGDWRRAGAYTGSGPKPRE
jgi:hypothetical protein